MEKKEKNKKKNKKILLLLLLLLLFIIISIIVVYFIKLNKIKYTSIPSEDIEISSNVEEELNGFRNIVFIGRDDTAKEKDEERNSYIIFSIDQDNNNVKIVSINRNTYMQIPEYGYGQLEDAYEQGKETFVINTLNRNLDLNIKEYVTVNYSMVSKLVNAINGIEVELTKEDVKQITGIDMAGTYNLNGEQAIEYLKAKTKISKYNGAERMKQIVSIALSKIKECSLLEINNVTDELLPEIETNITKGDITKLLVKLVDINIESNTRWPYNETGKKINKVEYTIPVDVEENVKELHKNLFIEEEGIEYSPTETVKEISNEIKTKVK